MRYARQDTEEDTMRSFFNMALGLGFVLVMAMPAIARARPPFMTQMQSACADHPRDLVTADVPQGTAVIDLRPEVELRVCYVANPYPGTGEVKLIFERIYPTGIPGVFQIVANAEYMYKGEEFPFTVPIAKRSDGTVVLEQLNVKLTDVLPNGEAYFDVEAVQVVK